MTNASAPPLESLPSQDLQRARVVLDGMELSRLLSTWERLLSRTRRLKACISMQAREALVGGAAHPLAVGLHQW